MVRITDSDRALRWAKSSLLAALGCILSACAAGPAATPVGPVPLGTGSIDSFTPLVAPISASPRCERPNGPSLGEGEEALALVYESPPRRQVTVTLGADGAPIRYVDVRGDLSLDLASPGERTTIGLYLDADYAVLSNRAEGEPAVIFEVPLEDAIDADRLGVPSVVLDEVLSRCGSAPEAPARMIGAGGRASARRGAPTR